MEQLAYATRLMNVAAAEGKARELRDWLVASDAARDPQAYVLRPDVVVAMATEIVAEPTSYLRTRRAALATLDAVRQAVTDGVLKLARPEKRWLDRLKVQADELPEDEATFGERTLADADTTKVRLDQYGLA